MHLLRIECCQSIKCLLSEVMSQAVPPLPPIVGWKTSITCIPDNVHSGSVDLAPPPGDGAQVV